ncbi:restriction endonuclease subunit S [Rhodoferax sp.]|uniref:restriction endonuclease subunit S n=1 Tax=Rhodoferax sp. TaxID=50421 RepID=UPI0026042603|nr:restriction endonuclease subunit S [Rhodoferax sp.]MDD3935543.1 restriction endonuclease subunit S [Rhodoferax sp.]
MNATQLLPHFDRLAEAPNAVPRLRRFILDLAVRGKLVEQDAGDEPAGELLKRIYAHKADLVNERLLKVQSAFTAVPLALQPYRLKSNWMWAFFGSIMISRDGERIPVSKEERNTRAKTYDYYGASGVIDKIDGFLFDKPLLLIGEDGANLINRSTPIAFIARGQYWVNNHAHVLDGITEDFLRYIELYVNAIDLKAYVTGTAQPKMNQAKMNSIPVAIPPEAEQHRIVAKVDELMALCDQLEAAQQERERRRDRLAAASLQRLNQPAADTTPEAQREHARFHLQHLPHLTTRPEHIKAMRQLLVNLAVVGKLAQPEPNDEPAEVLLKKVWAEKKSRGLLKQAKESPEGNIDLIVNSLPAGWAWTTFESFATEIATGPFGSALHQSDYIDGGIPLVNPSHMIDGRIFVNPKISVSEETAKSLASYRMKSGDVVMARRGEVGRAAIVTDAEAGWLCGTGSFFVNFHKEIDRQFVILLLRSDAVRRYLAGEAVGTTMVNLNHGILKRIPLALPPAAEQHRIVAKVDELMALCDQLEAQLTTTQTDSRRLLEAVLVAALVPV